MSTKDVRQFQHPTQGPCTIDRRRLAIRWVDSTPQAERATVLRTNELTPITIPAAARQSSPLLLLNEGGISWVEASAGGTFDEPALEPLRSSPHVQWVNFALRSERAPEFEGTFTFDPTCVYLSNAAVLALGDQPVLSGLSSDPGRTAKLRGLACLRIDGRSPIEVLDTLAAELRQKGMAPRDGIVLENIPLVSPAAGCGCATRAPVVPCEVTTREVLPNDPQFPIAWGLRQIKAPYAWGITQGDPNIVVAVIDEGVELSHPDLVVDPQSWNASTDTPDGSPTGNHGTACAGIVAATVDNGLGVTGVAGNCRTMAIATSTWSDVDIAEGLYFAADHGARVVSMSFGVYPSWNFWNFDIIRDALQYAYDKGLVLVAASGNENIAESRFPGSDARTICVGGSNRADERKRVGDTSIETFWGACYGPSLDVVAPCLEIPTTDRLGAFGYGPLDYFDRFNGTSAATPHVAGLAALVLSARPTLTNETVREIIERTCDKVNPTLYPYALLPAKPNGTWHAEMGYGRINAERALLLACQHGAKAAECVSPPAPPWLPYDQCMLWYEPRYFRTPDFQIRVIFEHCVRLLGRQQGPLLFTMTLLPGESATLYHYERYRRVRSATQRLSVHSSYRQAVSALWQQRHVRTDSRKQNVLVNVRSEDDHDITIGGMLFDTSYDIDDPNLNLNLELTHNLQDVTDSFQQVLSSASQLVETERSLVVSNFEESESVNTTARSIRNPNPCYAVTYFVRRVMEVYELRTTIKEISVRRSNMRETAFRPVSDLAALPGEARTHLRGLPPELFRAGIVLQSPIRITIPTDGALYEAELAHCSSCDPARQAEVDLGLERARCELRRLCLEGDLMELEVRRRTALIDRGDLGPFLTAAAQPQVAWTPAERAPAVEVTATTPRLVT